MLQLFIFFGKRERNKEYGIKMGLLFSLNDNINIGKTAIKKFTKEIFKNWKKVIDKL